MAFWSYSLKSILNPVQKVSNKATYLCSICTGFYNFHTIIMVSQACKNFNLPQDLLLQTENLSTCEELPDLPAPKLPLPNTLSMDEWPLLSITLALLPLLARSIQSAIRDDTEWKQHYIQLLLEKCKQEPCLHRKTSHQ